MPEKVTMDSANLYAIVGKKDAYLTVLAKVNSVLDKDIGNFDDLNYEFDILRHFLEIQIERIDQELKDGKT